MRQPTLLRNTLLANAIFSLLCGLDALLLNRFFMNLFGINNPYVFPVLGVGLLLFCGMVFAEARRKEVKPRSIKAIIGQDVGWVVGSILIIITNVFSFSTAGLWLTAGVAGVVAVFAGLQYRGMKQAV
jgi:hypothetical protein